MRLFDDLRLCFDPLGGHVFLLRWPGDQEFGLNNVQLLVFLLGRWLRLLEVLQLCFAVLEGLCLKINPNKVIVFRYDQFGVGLVILRRQYPFHGSPVIGRIVIFDGHWDGSQRENFRRPKIVRLRI